LRQLKYKLQKYSWYRALHLTYAGWRANRALKHCGAALRRGQMATAENAAVPGKRILLATGAGGHLPSLALESLLGMALVRRSAEVDFLLCDGALSACMMCEVNWYQDIEALARTGPRDRCGDCHAPAARMLEEVGLRHLNLTEYIEPREREQAQQLAAAATRSEISVFSIGGVSVGEHALAGALRFYARGQLEDGDQATLLLRRYFEAALLTYFAARRIFANGRYQVVVLNHGIYVPQGVVAETARTMGVHVVTWHPAYRRQCFIFSHDETYHQSLMKEPTTEWEGMELNERQQAQIGSYLRSRWESKHDWIHFHHAPKLDANDIVSEVGIDFSKPTIGLLTNVIWDAQLHYPTNAFPSMLDWLFKTIAYFAQRPDLQLLIRVHPAEITGTVPARQRVIDEIRKAFPDLPANIFLIPPESRLSTYVAMSLCNAALIYGTKMGVELSAVGLPVIVAGEAWIRGKGVTLDATCEADYFRHLDALPHPGRLNNDVHMRALTYAFHFFFRRMIPLSSVAPQSGWPPFQPAIRDAGDLLPGRDKGLDVICQGILTGAPFVYPAETWSQ
jgi:hypothetical protein